MLLFWQHGYEATSIAYLTAALGITAPSLYAAFGDKKRLFLEAVDLYMTPPTPTADDESLSKAKAKPAAVSAKQTALDMMIGAAMLFTDEGHPRGCLVGSSALSVSAEAEDVRVHLAAIRKGVEKNLRSHIARAVREGELPAATETDALSAFIVATIQGMSTLARDGASREKLMSIVEIAMHAWPTTKR